MPAPAAAQPDLQTLDFAQVNPAPYNPRIALKPADPEWQDIEASLREFGYLGGMVWNRRTGNLVSGHQRMAVLAHLGHTNAAFTVVDVADLAEKRINLALNKITGRWEPQKLESLLAELRGNADPNALAGIGFSPLDISTVLDKPDKTEQARTTLAQRFLVPPFTVLNAREGWWQERKSAWIALGIQSELGRGQGVTFGDSPEITEPGLNHYRERERESNGTTLGVTPPNERDILKRGGRYAVKGRKANAVPGGSPLPLDRPMQTQSQNLTWAHSNNPDDTTQRILSGGRKPDAATFGTEGNASEQSGTSIFDPVLAELAYRWFCPPNGTILDPFAGGSVRGIVAALTARNYHGIDLRPEQTTANYAQAARICPPDRQPVWITGDSRDKLADAPEADFIFSCPPYADLELYSDDPRDLSRIAADSYQGFLAVYREIIAKALARLKPNRFACFVCGEVRDAKGNYRNFIGDTITAFQDAGAQYYNEAILVTAAGSLPIRAGKQFAASRKLGKTHQNVLVFQKGLVFVKGTGKAAAQICGTVDVDEALFFAELEATKEQSPLQP